MEILYTIAPICMVVATGTWLLVLHQMKRMTGELKMDWVKLTGRVISLETKVSTLTRVAESNMQLIEPSQKEILFKE